MERTTTFCEGMRCVLRDRCHRYVDGQRIAPRATGYDWMQSCDEEKRDGYVPIDV